MTTPTLLFDLLGNSRHTPVIQHIFKLPFALLRNKNIKYIPLDDYSAALRRNQIDSERLYQLANG